MHSTTRTLKSSALALALGASAALAMPIDINPNDTFPANNGQATVTAWLNGLITTYNTTFDPDLPSPATLSFDSNVDPIPPGFPPNSGLSVVMPMGTYEYLVLKWGGGFRPGAFSAYYIGDEISGTTWTFNAPGKNELSGYRLYDAPTTSVPEGGTGVILLGSALGALALVRRRLPRV